MHLEMEKEAVLNHLDVSILNSFIFLISWGSKLSYRNFRHALVRGLTDEGRTVP
jgi:hypothetical protein